MIPVIIGAAVGLAGVAIFSGDDKSKQPEIERHEVSEDYVKRQLNRAGKNFSPDNNFSANFAGIKNVTAKNMDKRFMEKELEKRMLLTIRKRINQQTFTG